MKTLIHLLAFVSNQSTTHTSLYIVEPALKLAVREILSEAADFQRVYRLHRSSLVVTRTVELECAQCRLMSRNIHKDAPTLRSLLFLSK
jgi:hypothetical protein